MASQKKLFVIVAVDDPAKLGARIVAEYPDAHLMISGGQWLIVGESSNTTTEVSHKLKITDDTTTPPRDNPGSAIVMSVSNYYGRAPRNVWEWISSKVGGTDGVAG